MKPRFKEIVIVVLLFICSFSNAQEKPSAFMQKVKQYSAKKTLTPFEKNNFYNSKISEASATLNNELRAYTYYHKAFNLFALGESNDSIFFCLNTSLHFTKQIKDYELLSNTYAKYAQFLVMHEQNLPALVYCDSAIIASKKINYTYGLYSAYSSKTRINTSIGNLDKALQNAFESQKYATNVTDSLDLLRRFSIIYTHKEDYNKAEFYFKEIINISLKQKTQKDSIRVLQTMANASQFYNGMDLQSKRKKQLDNALKFSVNFQEPYLRANVMRQLADYHLHISKQIDSSVYFLDKINQDVPEVRELDFLADLNETRGDFYFEKKQYTKAIDFYTKTYDFYKEANHLERTKSVLSRLSSANEKINNHKLALNYFKEYQALNDSINNKQEIEKFKEIELNNEFEKEKLATQLAYQKEITKEKETRLFLILGLSVLGLAALFGFYAYTRKRKESKLLSEKNEIVNTSLKEKELMVKEIHHRVKNNFQIVSSLLELQNKGIEDKKALALANEGQTRVKSMAMIHQRLYQNESGLIDFDDYIHHLVKELSTLYASDAKVETNVSSEDMLFDVDTAIPLGLIINELITNAYKYAFKDNENSKLNISIKKVTEGNYKLEVSDNGNGIDPSFNIKTAKSLGLRLVNRLTKQLHGKVSLVNEDGANFEILFKDINTRRQVS